MRVTVLAPAYNENEVIAHFVAAATSAIEPGWEVLVVDDGSADGTSEILVGLSVAYPELRVVSHPENWGLGAALATGFEAARGEVIVTMDADLSHPFELIPDLVAACAAADAAFASRFVPGGAMVGVPWLRRWVSRLGNMAFRALFLTRVRDLTTGYRAYRTSAVRELSLLGQGFETQLEISVRLVHAKRRIVELPLRLTTRAAGQSKMQYLSLVSTYGSMVLRMVALRWGPSRRVEGRD
jgi:dolichol-phosphate mannosyltransferase